MLALTLVPVAAAILLRAPAPDADEDVWIIRRIKRLYAPALDGAMRHAGLVQMATVAITVPAIALALVVGSDFMPQLDEGAFLLQTVMPPDTALDEVDRINHRVEDVLRKFDDVEDVVRRTGRAERTEDPMPHVVSDVLVVLKPERVGELESLEAEMREALESVPGVSDSLHHAARHAHRRGARRHACGSLGARLRPRSERAGACSGSQVQALMADIDGIEDLRVEAVTGLPQLRVSIDRPAVARTGLTPGDVVRALRIGLVGEEASEVWVGQRRYGLVVRLADSARNSVSAIRNLRLEAHDGTPHPDRPGRAQWKKSWRRAPSGAREETGASRSKRASPAAISGAPPRMCGNDWRQGFSCPRGISSRSEAASSSRSGRRSL